MAIKHIIFDLGKVLVDYDFDLFFDKLGIGKDSINWDSDDELLLQFERGLISAEEFHQSLAEKFNFKISFEQFKEAWCCIFPETTALVPFAAELVIQFNVFVFSNTDPLHYPFVRNKFPELDFLGNNEMLSYDLGAVKPEKAAFLKAIAKYNLNPAECLFVDDKVENVMVAKKFGMDALLCTNPSSCVTEMRFLLENEQMVAFDPDKKIIRRKGLDRRQRERRRKELGVPIERRRLDDRRSGAERRRRTQREDIPFLKKMMIKLFVKK